MGNCMNTINMTETPSIVFTRYLYLKDEVTLSLLIALLEKNNGALYWAYELYYSGFKEYLFHHLWRIYYDFYYTLNPSFHFYFLKKYNEWRKTSNTEEKTLIVALIVSDLLIRPHNFDVFMLRQCHIYALDKFIVDSKTSFYDILLSEDYLRIYDYIAERKGHGKSCNELLITASEFFSYKGLSINCTQAEKKWLKAVQTSGIDEHIVLIAWIIHLFSQLHGLPMGRNLYMQIEPHELVVYETIFQNEETKYSAYKILPLAYLFPIDEDHYLSLFQLERNKIIMDDPDGLRKKYYYHWEYYASFSPIWLERIRKFRGKQNHSKKSVEFENDNYMEEFYNKYGYEPDEQPKEIQDYSMQDIHEKRSWCDYFTAHSKHCVYIPPIDILNSMKNVMY